MVLCSGTFWDGTLHNVYGHLCAWEHVIIWVYAFPMWPAWNWEITVEGSQSKQGKVEGEGEGG